jgi:hypothetical protein
MRNPRLLRLAGHLCGGRAWAAGESTGGGAGGGTSVVASLLQTLRASGTAGFRSVVNAGGGGGRSVSALVGTICAEASESPSAAAAALGLLRRLAADDEAVDEGMRGASDVFKQAVLDDRRTGSLIVAGFGGGRGRKGEEGAVMNAAWLLRSIAIDAQASVRIADIVSSSLASPAVDVKVILTPPCVFH